MQEPQGVRINKYLADSGACSRRQADELIAARRVQIDGVTAETGARVMPWQKVTLDGRELRANSRKRYIALNKPVGIVCTTDPREPYNIVDYIGADERLYPIGRLDKDSSGLILLTNDGDIVNKILRAGNNHEKEYIVRLDRAYDGAFLRRMSSGVPVLDTVTRPCTVRRITDREFGIVLTQGLNRQIRRMCEYLGYRVAALKRVRIMNIRLGSLKVGQYRDLTADELRRLLASLKDSHNDVRFAPAGDRGAKQSDEQ